MSHSFTIPLETRPPAPPTRHMCEAAARLGITVDQAAPAHAGARSITLDLAPGARVLITGASGAGKSTLLRAVGATLRDAGWPVISPPASLPLDWACLAVFGRPVNVSHAMRCLSRAGLGDASVFTRRVGELSAGQHDRLRLGVAMHRAERLCAGPAAMLIDELGASLDPHTGAGVARLLRRFSDRLPNVRVVAATPREDLETPFAPTSTIRLSPGSDPVAGSPTRTPEQTIRFEPGDRPDYHALAPLHYRAGPPATISHVFRAVESAPSAPDRLVGVLTLSLPTLNAAWRDLAWPGRFSTSDKALNARRLNEEIRCISRVIIVPDWRGAGLARRLVRWALDHSPTPGIEALAAMGSACPFFEAAGMTAYPVARSERDSRLLDLFTLAGIEPWRFSTPRDALRRVDEAIDPRLLDRELRRWASRSRDSRGSSTGPRAEVFGRACARLAAHFCAYAWCDRHWAPRQLAPSRPVTHPATPEVAHATRS